MPVIQHRARRLSTSSNTDDLHAEIETLQVQLDTTQSNLGTLRGTNNRLNDRIQKLEAQLDDNAVHVQTQEKDINSLRRQLRISSAEITRLRTEREVLEKDYEGVNKDVLHEREERRKLMEKISELEEQVASALHLHVVSSSRVPGAAEAKGSDGDQKQMTSWLDLKAKLREAENELDAVQQERDWLEGQLEKFIHAKDALDSNFSIKNLRSRTSMGSIADSARSFGSSSRRSSTSSHAPVNKQSLGQELGLEWNGEYDSDVESDGSGDSDSTERADNESEAGLEHDSLPVPKIVADDASSVASSSKRSLNDFAMRLDTSGRSYRGRSRAPSFASSHRAPSIAASLRSRMSTHSLRPGSRLGDFDDAPPPPITATAVFHEIERQHDAKVSKLQNDIVTLSTDLQGEIELLQQEVNTAREERDVCVLEIQRLNTEISVANARHQDSMTALDAALAAAAAAREQARLELLTPPPPAPTATEVKEIAEVKEIGIQTDEYEPESRIREVVQLAVAEVIEESKRDSEEQLEEGSEQSEEAHEEHRTPSIREESVPVIAEISREIPAEPEVSEPVVSHFTTALEAEIATLREQEQSRLADNLKLKSEIDVLHRDLREKDTLLRAEVVRLEKDLDDLVRDNRNMKDDAEINHYKVENLADELDRTRELLQIQAGERREFMEEIEQLEARNRDLELQLRIRLATPSPVPPSSIHETHDQRPTARFNDMAPFIFPLKDSSSAKSDFEDDTLDRSDDDFALMSDSESDAPPPSPLPAKHKRRKSSSAKHKRHHSKKERKKEKQKEKEKEKEEPTDMPKEISTSRKQSVSKLPIVSKIPTASKIPSATKASRKSLTLPRSISSQLPSALKSAESPPPSPLIESRFERGFAQEQSRTRSSTIPMKIPRPSIGFRASQAPVDPPPDKTYWKDLMIGGYGMQPQEYNKHRRDMRSMHKNMQIKVTAKGIETKGRVGTGAGFGVGNYADQPELKPIPKRKVPKRRTSFSDDEAYTHKERGSWLSGMFRK
ncbi:hypothetical protein H072_10656 [Dactylellina haptotyla CBS 200.50]|uniref:Uncharacterized protein n=1 Tax=Dactylellina haptotyla (strain CBS 200.50) TaxID=1284197 RepID=S8B9Y2_DACHA|nr:hypothetical protein H072_10656 [Dactylellina haptotyla CBS 200.50]